MKKIILTSGSIIGIVTIGGVILSLTLTKGSDSSDYLQGLGFLIMFAAFSLLFISVKRYRDDDLGGVIKFGTAFTLGLGITIAASVIYVVVWEINLALSDYAFMDDYTESIVAAAIEAGTSGAELDTVRANMDEMRVNYASAVYRLPMTFLEIFPVGLLISLVSAWILKRSDA